MKFRKIINTLDIVDYYIENHLNETDTVIDCTLGNGIDSLKLKQKIGVNGLLFGFDIQEEALNKSYKLLEEHNFNNNITLIHDSHENIDKYVEYEIADLIIYNLGYLPGGNKSIKTNSSSTSISLKKSLKIIKNHGLVLITVYIGHEGGIQEKEAIENILKHLDQKTYNVLKHEFINQINNPPIFYAIERIT